MDLQMKNKLFIVCGATSGFGNAVAERLIEEGAEILAIARNESNLLVLKEKYPGVVDVFPGDITSSKTIDRLSEKIKNRHIEGILVNAGGPPAKTFIETSLEDWDNAYHQLLRWKVELIQKLLPNFISQGYGRVLFIESASVKQPIENLILSTSLRLSVVGMVKTLSQEIPDKNITFNILAPGYHLTPAVERLIAKKMENTGKKYHEAMANITKNIPMNAMGETDKFASLALWLLSPMSAYVTGQTYLIDGGLVKATL
ncbi:MAG: SDR family oxidoreductase [Bacteroidales bacterium]|nr:SDR family oxidoreductase [Bacteroidales bacterium]